MRGHVERVARALPTFLIYRPRALWYGIGLPAALVYAAYEYPPKASLTPDERSVVAAVLEFGGLLLIARGYVELRERFGRPSLWQSFRSYARAFGAALRPSAPRTLSAQMSGSVGLTGNATAIVRPGAGSSLERRLEILEGRIDTTDAELRELSKQLTHDSTDLRAQLASLRAEVEKEVQALKILVEHASVGDAGSEVVGWLWLLTGIMVSSWSSWRTVLLTAP